MSADDKVKLSVDDRLTEVEEIVARLDQALATVAAYSRDHLHDEKTGETFIKQRL